MDAQVGRIADDDAVLVFNYGDPAYRATADATPGLALAEEIFLRMIASLVFADSLCVPVRHVLHGRPMADAIRLASPLLQEGIIRPARRRVFSSFEDYAIGQKVDSSSVIFGRFLDRNVRRPYLFDEQGMAAANRVILTVISAGMAPSGEP
jgi:hypothetical protein